MSRCCATDPRRSPRWSQLIDGATTTVALESYIFRSDEVGRAVRRRARRAPSTRGVDVRLLLDWIGGRGTSRKFIKRTPRTPASRSPSSIRQAFAPGSVSFRATTASCSSSTARVGITGGVGVGREWTTGVQKLQRSRWRDTAVRDRRPGRARHGAGVRPHVASHRRDTSAADRTGFCAVRRAARISIRRPTRPRSSASSKGEPLRLRVSRALQIQAISARRSIWIATAYFTPSPSEVEALNGAARDGVDVRVLVPSRNDHPWVSLLARRYYRRLLTNGVRIWEWRGEMMHAKTSVDRRTLGARRLDRLQSTRRRHQLRARRRDRGRGARASRPSRCSSQTWKSRVKSRCRSLVAWSFAR